MLGEYKVSRSSRRCASLDRPLREGETYYSVVIESADQYVRRDYAAEAWQGPPADAIGWWKCRMPRAEEQRRVLAPKEVLIDLLRQTADVSNQAKSRYLLALLLLRRRIIRPAPAAVNDSGAVDAGSPDQPALLRVDVGGEPSIIEIPVCQISRSEAESLRNELNQLIYCEAEDSDTEL